MKGSDVLGNCAFVVSTVTNDYLVEIIDKVGFSANEQGNYQPEDLIRNHFPSQERVKE